MNKRSIGSHHSTRMKSDTWLTPRYITDALGKFDLDPCAYPDWPIADYVIFPPDDGLKEKWVGRVWLNPPYSREARKWLAKLAKHGDGIALIFARTETQWFVSEIWEKAQAILFLHGRITFELPGGKKAPGNSGAPSCLVAYGTKNCRALQQSGLRGSYVRRWSTPEQPELL